MCAVQQWVERNLLVLRMYFFQNPPYTLVCHGIGTIQGYKALMLSVAGFTATRTA
jgi:hypothetical protein